MAISKGDSVQVKEGRKDIDTDTSIAAWSGTVVNIDDSILEVEWDAPTLAQLPGGYILNCLDEGYRYESYYIEERDVDKITPKSTKKETLAMKKALDNHYLDYELRDVIPSPFGDKLMGQQQESKEQVKSLLKILKEVIGNGTFLTSGYLKFIHPGLIVEGVGVIAMPILPEQARKLIDKSSKAPFGKGSQTIMDTSVRSAWEIDAEKLRFDNPDWDKEMGKVLKAVKKSLGLKKVDITASLYKLLIYEKGDFFLPHKDSEKEEGMFGTLIINLPSVHEGGALWVRFDGKEECIDFATSSTSFQIPYVAFYSDCEHEVKPVMSGYRICLVYNLIQLRGDQQIGLTEFDNRAEKIEGILKNMLPSFYAYPKAILLDHQYTPANFSLQCLKGNDKPRTETLMRAAEQAGFYTKLGLVTLYQMGQLEEGGDYYDSYYGYQDEEIDDGFMGEVYEEYITIEHWAEDKLPELGELSIHESGIIGHEKIGEGKPIEQEEEGYTGNAGMTIEYWYHYGAVFLWPKMTHAKLLAKLQLGAKLKWLDYYSKHWEEGAISVCSKLLQSISLDLIGDTIYWKHEKLDCNSIAKVLILMSDPNFIKEKGVDLIGQFFNFINEENWVALVRHYSLDVIFPAIQKATSQGDTYVLYHLIKVLNLMGEERMTDSVIKVLQKLPPTIKNAQLYKLSKNTSAHYGTESVDVITSVIVEQLLSFTDLMVDETNWVDEVGNALCTDLPRNYVNEILVPLLATLKFVDNPLGNLLYDNCRADLIKRTATEPMPPKDWSRKVPASRYYQQIWDELSTFITDPDQRVLDYKAVKAIRKTIESAVKSTTIDLKMETIRKGSPHTLRLTKTRDAYRKEHNKWKKDMELLKLLEGK